MSNGDKKDKKTDDLLLNKSERKGVEYGEPAKKKSWWRRIIILLIIVLIIVLVIRSRGGDAPKAMNDFIVVDSPLAGDVIGDNLEVSGSANVFEGTLLYRLFDEDGATLAEGFTTTLGGEVGEFADFEIDTPVSEAVGSEGVLEVYTISAVDGSEENLLQIPVMFESEEGKMMEDDVMEHDDSMMEDDKMMEDKDAATVPPPSDKMLVTLYFANDQTGGDNCSLVFPVKRSIDKTVAVAGATMKELLKGPSSSEAGTGFKSLIPAGLSVTDLKIDNGVATVSFSQSLETSGSCDADTISSQIEETLKQFSTVQSVVIN